MSFPVPTQTQRKHKLGPRLEEAATHHLVSKDTANSVCMKIDEPVQAAKLIVAHLPPGNVYPQENIISRCLLPLSKISTPILTGRRFGEVEMVLSYNHVLSLSANNTSSTHACLLSVGSAYSCSNSSSSSFSVLR